MLNRVVSESLLTTKEDLDELGDVSCVRLSVIKIS